MRKLTMKGLGLQVVPLKEKPLPWGDLQCSMNLPGSALSCSSTIRDTEKAHSEIFLQQFFMLGKFQTVIYNEEKPLPESKRYGLATWLLFMGMVLPRLTIFIMPAKHSIEYHILKHYCFNSLWTEYKIPLNMLTDKGEKCKKAAEPTLPEGHGDTGLGSVLSPSSSYSRGCQPGFSSVSLSNWSTRETILIGYTTSPVLQIMKTKLKR